MSLIEDENIKNHQENVRRSHEIANTIRNKVADLIEKIKKEETKLLNNVQEFSNAEQRLESPLIDLRQSFCIIFLD